MPIPRFFILFYIIILRMRQYNVGLYYKNVANML